MDFMQGKNKLWKRRGRQRIRWDLYTFQRRKG